MIPKFLARVLLLLGCRAALHVHRSARAPELWDLLCVLGSQSSAFLEMSAVSCAFCKLPPLCSNHSQKNGSPIPNTIYLENGLYSQEKKKQNLATWLQERTIGCGYEPLAILSSSQTHPGSLTLVNTFPPLLSYDPCLQIEFWPSYLIRKLLNKKYYSTSTPRLIYVSTCCWPCSSQILNKTSVCALPAANIFNYRFPSLHFLTEFPLTALL